MKEPNIDELSWIRLFTPIHIPDYLIEQVRDRDYSIEDFKKYQTSACVIQNKDGFSLNPLNHLYILVDKKSITKGFVWFTINPLSKDIFINTFSIDKDYWFKGRAVSKLADFIKEIKEQAKLNKVIWVTNYPKHSIRYGFKRSKSVLMEYTGEEENGKTSMARRSTARGKHRSIESSAATVLERNSGRTGTGEPSGTGIQPISATE